MGTTFVQEWGIEFTDSLDGQPNFVEWLDNEPSQEIKNLIASYAGRELVSRWVSPLTRHPL
jgi:hypothetical protein